MIFIKTAPGILWTRHRLGFGINAADVAAIKAKTDNLPADPADESLLEAEVRKGSSRIIFWSYSDDLITLTTPAGDVDLPNVLVDGLPAGITILRVDAVIKIRALDNSAAVVNAISGAQSIRIKKSTGTWGVDDIAAIDLPTALWTLAATTREAGDVLVGDNDLSSVVDGNAIYNLRFENALVTAATLKLNDVLVGLIISYKVG